MNQLAVFCGSASGASPDYAQKAVELGQELARQQIGLVYGGSDAGLMAAAADAALAEGGQVTGVIPTVLADREIAHTGLTELFVVSSMHERKAKMAELSDAFIVLPGGAGTMEEFFEMFTWAQIGLHEKPIGLLNVNGYFDPLIAFFDHMTAEQFLQPAFREMLLVDESPAGLLEQFRTYAPPAVKVHAKKAAVSETS